MFPFYQFPDELMQSSIADIVSASGIPRMLCRISTAGLYRFARSPVRGDKTTKTGRPPDLRRGRHLDEHPRSHGPARLPAWWADQHAWPGTERLCHPPGKVMPEYARSGWSRRSYDWPRSSAIAF